MNENKTPRKELIKNIAIIFLAALLILTFFSNTIMNYSLPQVTASYVSQGNISEQIRGSGTVEAAEKYEVKFDSTREVKSVSVQTGQTVKAGDVLFELNDEESAEYKDALSTLESMELEYQKALLAYSVSSEYKNEYAEIAKAEEELEKLKAQYESSVAGEDPLSAAENNYNTAKKDKESTEREIEALNAELSSLETEDMLDVSKENYDKLFSAKEAVTKAEEKETKYQKEYDEAAKDCSGTDYENQIIDIESEMSANKSQLSDLYFQYYSVLNDAEAASSIMTQITSIEAAIDKLGSQLQKLYNDAASESAAQGRLSNAQRKLSSAQNSVLERKKELAELIRGIKLEIKAKLDELKEKLYSANDTMESAQAVVEEAQASGLLSKTQLASKISEQQTKIEELKSSLELKQETDVQNQSDKLDLDAKKKALDKQKETVDKLKSESFDAKITAKVGGVIESISAVAGGKLEAGTTACVIVVEEKGYKVEFPVKNEQAKKVSVGAKAEITSWYWGENFSAVLSEIKPDTANPQSQKILVFNVTGSDISVNQTITLSMGSKGQPYSTVVPNSAIREDSNGKFVLVMEAKSSPLGNRYKAVRYDVEVIAKDDNYSAVEGLLGSEFVITASTSPIEAGNQVRPAD